jgi:hypothetical protein
MCIGQSIEWLNNNSGAIMALLTAVYAIATIALYLSSHRSISIAKQLHRDVHRPVIVCDFVIIHTVTYFRIRNIGTVSACNLRISHEEVNVFKSDTSSSDDKEQEVKTDLQKGYRNLPDFENGIPFFSPGQEILYFFQGPVSVEFPMFRFTMKYSDPFGNIYCDKSEINLSIYKETDIGRENNDPVVKKLDDICSAIKDFENNFLYHLIITMNKPKYFRAKKTDFDDSDDTNEIEIGDEAKQLLLEASKDKDGIIMKTRSSSGTIIQTNRKNMIPSPHDARTVAKWEQAIKELLENGFIEERGYKGEVFAVTHKGYEYTDKLQGNK